MALQSTRQDNTRYFYELDKPEFYGFDSLNMVHVIRYILRDYGNAMYTGEWKVPGTERKDVEYAKRWTLLLTPVISTITY